MKITKTEKIWLAVVLFFYIAYNLPLIPAYHDAKGTIIHGILTLIPLWIAIYAGLVKVCRIYKLKDEKTAEDLKESEAEKEDTKVC